MKTRVSLSAVAALAWVLALTPTFGADEKAKPTPKPAMDEKAMMEAWQKFAAPGEPHKKLAALEGTWLTHTKSTMAPGAPPEETEGIAEQNMVLGGRYLKQRFDGKMMGQAFSGTGYTGYDNFKKKYVGIWMDTAGTGIMVSEGTEDASGKVITFTSQIDDIVTGKKMRLKSVVTLVDEDHNTYEMWGPGPDGKQYRMLEVHYTRKK